MRFSGSILAATMLAHLTCTAMASPGGNNGKPSRSASSSSSSSRRVRQFQTEAATYNDPPDQLYNDRDHAWLLAKPWLEQLARKHQREIEEEAALNAEATPAPGGEHTVLRLPRAPTTVTPKKKSSRNRHRSRGHSSRSV